VLLRKDLEIGLFAERVLDVPLPLAAHVREILQALTGQGDRDCDLSAQLEVDGKAAGMAIPPEYVEVDPGI
jgi:3-hydroxyisobutyrate dehydrogenase